MARTKGPLFSEEAQKQLGKSIIFKTKAGKTFVTRYNKPGGVKSFSPSESQTEKREMYAAAVGLWRALSDAEKEEYNKLVKQKNLKMSGWNYFYKLVTEEPECLCGLAYFGTGCFGKAIFGKEDY